MPSDSVEEHVVKKTLPFAAFFLLAKATPSKSNCSDGQKSDYVVDKLNIVELNLDRYLELHSSSKWGINLPTL